MSGKVSIRIILDETKILVCISYSDYDIALVRINYPVQDDKSGSYNLKILYSTNILQRHDCAL